ncbi:MAG TPA: PQQ-binding-like beta-propeller repeat protein [Chthoniobacterales bacterium]|nr:PQQ-binding-like beta-propeller repeat protein [Chthoniobacterales bacterium]
MANWTFTAAPPTEPDQPGEAFVASPVVSNGVVYIGANTGIFYALDESSGLELWHRSLGYSPHKTCPGRGISSTATVGRDASRGGERTVYVAGGNGYLYALRASDGVKVWRSFVVNTGTTENTGYNWASPTVINGHVYMGISSDCDDPLIRGGIKDFDQATGALLHTYWSVPKGSLGASVWTTPASDGKKVWAVLGNGDSGDSFAIVRLDAATFTREDSWVVPDTTGTDLDWGSSPTLFHANVNGTLTKMVGAASKNGKYYAFKAFDLASGPVWGRELGVPGDPGALKTTGLLLAAAIWDLQGKRLFVGSNETTIAGVTTAGSMRRLDRATGNVIWETPVSGGPIMGSPSMSAGGVIAAATYNTENPSLNQVYLLNASDGSVLNAIQQNAPIFAQPVFADTHLFVATTSATLTAYSTTP